MSNSRKFSTAVIERSTVRVSGRLRCECGYTPQAYDFERRDGRLVAICPTCHHDWFCVEDEA